MNAKPGRENLPFAEMHQFIVDLQEYPRYVQRQFVEPEFNFAEHNELYEKAYQYRNTNQLAYDILVATCMGKKVKEEAVDRMIADLKEMTNLKKAAK